MTFICYESMTADLNIHIFMKQMVLKTFNGTMSVYLDLLRREMIVFAEEHDHVIHGELEENETLLFRTEIVIIPVGFIFRCS